MTRESRSFRGLALWTICVEPTCGVDLLRCHSACNVAHLLADVVVPGAGSERLKLGVQVDLGLPPEPGRAGLAGKLTVAGAAGCYVPHRGAVGNDPRRFALGG